MKSNQIIGVFDDEEKIVDALKKLDAAGIHPDDIYGPFADHHILKKFTRPSRIPHLAFLYGLTAVIGTFAFVYWVSVIDYPIQYGGKPIFSFPPMLVLMYLMMILTTGTLSVFTLLFRTKLFPGKPASKLYGRALDDQFIMLFTKPASAEQIIRILHDAGATEIKETDKE